MPMTKCSDRSLRQTQHSAPGQLTDADPLGLEDGLGGSTSYAMVGSDSSLRC
jgi:hypothetical protein